MVNVLLNSGNSKNSGSVPWCGASTVAASESYITGPSLVESPWLTQSVNEPATSISCLRQIALSTTLSVTIVVVVITILDYTSQLDGVVPQGVHASSLRLRTVSTYIHLIISSSYRVT